MVWSILLALMACEPASPADPAVPTVLVPTPEPPGPTPVLGFPAFDPPFGLECDSDADPAMLSCSIPEGWDQGAGWCTADFTAEIDSVVPLDELTIRYEVEYFEGPTREAGLEVFYQGPVASTSFVWPTREFSPESCAHHRLVVADGTACAVCESVTCLYELFAPGDPDEDGWSDFEDCGYCDPTIYPGAPDPPGDWIDQDCDGEF